MTHYFASKHPEIPRAIAPVFGLPLLGFRDVPKELATVPILQFFDRDDETIPWAGGVSGETGDGWIYESLSTVLATWARNHHCMFSVRLKGSKTPYDGGQRDMRCYEFHQC